MSGHDSARLSAPAEALAPEEPFMCITLPLIATLVLTADEEPKPEPPPAIVKEVLDKYLKAVAAKDRKAMTALAEVPWLERCRRVVRQRTQLGKARELVGSQLPNDRGQRKVESFPYKKLRDRIKDETERKVFGEDLGGDGWMISVEEDG